MPRARCNGVEIEYEVRGEGEPLVFIMGIGAQLSDWPDGMLEAYQDAGFQLILLDNRDMGLSERLHHVRVPKVPQLIARGMAKMPVKSAYKLEDMADDVAALLTHLGHDSAHIFGASLGGMIAQAFAIKHQTKTRSLTSVMSSAGRRRNAIGTPAAMRALLQKPAQTREQAEDQSVNFVRVCGSKAWPMDEGLVRELAGRSFERAPDKSGFIRQLAAVVATGSRYQALRTVTAPTAVVHGAIDPLVRPGGGKDTARMIPGATLRMIEGMGHDLPEAVWPILVEETLKVADLGERKKPREAA